MLGQSYFQFKNGVAKNGILARIALYAWGRDYHKLLKKKAKSFVKALNEALQGESELENFDFNFESRILVDTSPLAEKVLALKAGLGWMGKNTLVINQNLGSKFFICLVWVSFRAKS